MGRPRAEVDRGKSDEPRTSLRRYASRRPAQCAIEMQGIANGVKVVTRNSL